MKIINAFIGGILFTSAIFGQTAIGTRTIIFEDPTRTGGFPSGGTVRQIQCEIYYPAATAGSNVAVAAGEYPVIVFGHGFAMGWDAYENIWEEMVPKGYIMVFPRTEGGLIPAPVHEDFGKDLALVEQLMVAEGNSSASPFYQKLNNRNAIMGHSMGGGATILAAANNTSIKTIIGLAPAETNPSAIAAAANVTVPALVLSGGQDGVTPPADHHIPIYTALDADFKTFVNIVGGAHCYFANSNFNCDFGESTSSTGISITRAEHQQKMYDLITPWLAFYLKGECNGFTDIETAISASGLTNQRTCNYTPFEVSGVITDATGASNGAVDITVTNGLAPYAYEWNNSATSEDITGVPGGIYTVSVTDAFCTSTTSFEVNGSSTPTSIVQQNQIHFTIMPNPADERIIINSNSNLGMLGEISIYNVYGQLISNNKLTLVNGVYEQNIAELTSGIYFIEMKGTGMSPSTVKLVKK
jgi:dienelactone hydrolase